MNLCFHAENLCVDLSSLNTVYAFMEFHDGTLDIEDNDIDGQGSFNGDEVSEARNKTAV